MGNNWPKIIAHRGSGQPENSLVAFERAMNAGVDGIEVDVFWANGQFFLGHDIGKDSGSGETLAALLSLVMQQAFLGELLIELKGEKGAQELLQVVTAWPEANQITLQSFHWHQVKLWTNMGWGHTAYLRHFPNLRAVFFAPTVNMDIRFWMSRFMILPRRRGYWWTANTPKRLRRLLTHNVTGIITNDPVLAMRMRDKLWKN
jgi:glycerophosphoryl diester phosphodiesterase